MPPFTDIWEITPETAHPRAWAPFGDDSILWDHGYGDFLLSGDIRADTFASFLSFQIAQPTGSVRQFLREESGSMEIPDGDWDLFDPVDLQAGVRC